MIARDKGFKQNHMTYLFRVIVPTFGKSDTDILKFTRIILKLQITIELSHRMLFVLMGRH